MLSSKAKKKKLCLTSGLSTSDSLAVRSHELVEVRSGTIERDIRGKREERSGKPLFIQHQSCQWVSRCLKHIIWFFVANEIMGLFKREIKRSKWGLLLWDLFGGKHGGAGYCHLCRQHVDTKSVLRCCPPPRPYSLIHSIECVHIQFGPQSCADKNPVRSCLKLWHIKMNNIKSVSLAWLQPCGGDLQDQRIDAETGADTREGWRGAPGNGMVTLPGHQEAITSEIHKWDAPSQ